VLQQRKPARLGGRFRRCDSGQIARQPPRAFDAFAQTLQLLVFQRQRERFELGLCFTKRGLGRFASIDAFEVGRMGRACALEFARRLRDALDRALQWFAGADARHAHLLLHEFPDALDRRLGRLARTPGRRGALQLLLKLRGVVEDSQDVRLPDADRLRQDRARQAEQRGCVGHAIVHQLRRQLTARDEVDGATGDLVAEVLLDLNPPAVVEVEVDLDGPWLAAPRPVSFLEFAIPLALAGPAPHAGHPRDHRGMQIGLARLVRAVDDVHAACEFEDTIAKRAEGLEVHARDPHQITSRSSRPSSARRPVTSTRRLRRASRSDASTSRTN